MTTDTLTDVAFLCVIMGCVSAVIVVGEIVIRVAAWVERRLQ